MTDPILVELHDGVAVVTMNAPDRRNAVSTAMRLALVEALDRLFADPNCGALVLTGAGGTFCAGGDIREMQKHADAAPPDGSRLKMMHDVVRRLAFGTKPVVAAVEGNAAGAGVSLAAACDCVVAATDARFIPAFARMGLIADCGLLWSLPRRVGRVGALDMLMSCRTIDGVEALALGLADRTAPPGKALETALEQARVYLKAAPLALAAVRRHLKGSPSELDTELAAELDLQAALRVTEDHREARTAFLERRPPIFRGK